MFLASVTSTEAPDESAGTLVMFGVASDFSSPNSTFSRFRFPFFDCSQRCSQELNPAFGFRGPCLFSLKLLDAEHGAVKKLGPSLSRHVLIHYVQA